MTTEQHPFTRPTESEAEMFIQWKGAEVCMDFTCRCGAFGHFDGYGAYFVKCPSCGTVYEMGTQVIAKVVDPAKPKGFEKVLDVDPNDQW